MERFFPSSMAGGRNKSPARLRWAVGFLNWLHLDRVTVYGIEHLLEIRPEEKIIVAATHLGDLDMPLAIGVMANHFDLVIANESLQHVFWKRKRINLALRLAGINHFLPIEYRQDAAAVRGLFNADNFLRMKQALDAGKTLLIAAHNPAAEDRLPPGGYGAVYTAQITDRSVILPVTINVESSDLIDSYRLPNPLSRPNAQVFIHAPMHLEKTDDLETFVRLAEKRRIGIILTAEEQTAYACVRQALQHESDKIMRVLAAPLPVEKRGTYQ